MLTSPWCAWSTPSSFLSASCPSAYLTPPSSSLRTPTAGLLAGGASTMEVRLLPGRGWVGTEGRKYWEIQVPWVAKNRGQGLSMIQRKKDGLQPRDVMT